MSGPERLRAGLQAAGFDVVKFAAAGTVLRSGLEDWLRQGYQADMDWMERSKDKRLDPALVLPGVQSVILLGVNYWSAALPAGAGPRFARYAQHIDYHDSMKPALERAGKWIEEVFGVTGADYRYYTDTGPVLERGWAARAGVGFQGKNAMLISRDYGNWLMLGAILVKVALPPDAPLPGDQRLCGKCTRCMNACPTDAFPQPGIVDARRCISYQTIENKGIIPRELREGIGARVFGCDVCLEVCPWNRFAQEARGVLMTVQNEGAKLGWGELLALTPESFARVFKGTPVKRLKLRGMLRNACIGAGNSGDAGLLPAVRPLLRHAEPMVRAHAVWAARRLGESAGVLAAAQAEERDPAVLAEYAP